jgi:2-polyprenyl-6-methoxyphenol hydroxylase-like FAD-dependent oxidoreductase
VIGMPEVGENAVVLGASMAGLVAARVLADFYRTVTVVERDPLPDNAGVRRGVPQGRHLHVLLQRGARILDELFPGFLDDLVTAGAPVWLDGDLSRIHLSFGGHQVIRTGTIPTDARDLALYMPSRPMLEWQVRQRVQAIGNVTILDGHDAGEVLSTPDRRRVTGARVVNRDDGAERVLAADVVMDATGRGARTPALLESLGYDRPVEDNIFMHTTYVSQLLRIPAGTLTEKLVNIGPVPGRPTGMFLTGYENDTWMFTVFGLAGKEPPLDLAGMLRFADGYCPEHLRAAVCAAEPVGEPTRHRMPSSQWRRYDKMRRLPDGLLVCGDAICSFNPIYGQGMTVAALDAAALRDCLSRGDADLPRRYFRASAKPIGVAWQLAAASDLSVPEVPGRRSPPMRVLTRLVDWALAGTAVDRTVAAAFFKVNSLIDHPVRLLQPTVVGRILLANVRRRRGIQR